MMFHLQGPSFAEVAKEAGPPADAPAEKAYMPPAPTPAPQQNGSAAADLRDKVIRLHSPAESQPRQWQVLPEGLEEERSAKALTVVSK